MTVIFHIISLLILFTTVNHGTLMMSTRHAHITSVFPSYCQQPHFMFRQYVTLSSPRAALICSDVHQHTVADDLHCSECVNTWFMLCLTLDVKRCQLTHCRVQTVKSCNNSKIQQNYYTSSQRRSTCSFCQLIT